MPNFNKMNVKRRTPFRMEIERGHDDMDALRFIMDHHHHSSIHNNKNKTVLEFCILLDEL